MKEYMSKDIDFYPFQKSWKNNMGKSQIKSLSSKYGQKLLDTTKELGTDALEAATKIAIHKTAGDLVVNKIAGKIKNLLQRMLMKMKKKPH